MGNVESGSPIWHGTVLVVTNPGQMQPELRLRCLGQSSDGTRDNGLNALVDGQTNVAYDGYSSGSQSRTFQGAKLYEDPGKCFWRFEIDLPFQSFEAKWEYDIPGMRQLSNTSGVQGSNRVFNVPSTSQSMRVLFHSCNGFSVGTDVNAWNGPALWNDALRMHHSQPFHVMIGGGDQIYNDGVRVDGPLQQWTNIGNPRKRREFPFNEELRAKCDQYYFNNYIRWYNTEPFRTANGQIPQLNMWDDHDIIDGFGSYTDHFMQCAVFRGIGGVAHKYVEFHNPSHPFLSECENGVRSMRAQAGGTPTRKRSTLYGCKSIATTSAEDGIVVECPPACYTRTTSMPTTRMQNHDTDEVQILHAIPAASCSAKEHIHYRCPEDYA